MGVSAAVAVGVIAAVSTTYSAVSANQQTQHAKGAAQAQATANQGQIDAAKKQDTLTQKTRSDQGVSTQTAAINALKASMSTANQAGGTILTGPSGAAPAPTAQKQLLGI